MINIALRNDHYKECPFNLYVECPECCNSEENIIEHLIGNHGYKEIIMDAGGGVRSFSGPYESWIRDTDWPKGIWRFGTEPIVVHAKSLKGVFHVHLYKLTKQAIRITLSVQNNESNITYKGFVPHIQEFQEHS